MIRLDLAKTRLRSLADAVGRRLEIARSEQWEDDLVARLNAVYADLPSGIPAVLRRAQAKSLSAE